LKKLRPSILPGIVWFIITTVLLSLPGAAFPKGNWLDKTGFDKWVHIGLFALLVFLLCWGILRFTNDEKKLNRLFLFFSIDSLVYGVIMEFIQGNLIPNRSFDVGDIVADALGCLLGWFMIKRYRSGYAKK